MVNIKEYTGNIDRQVFHNEKSWARILALFLTGCVSLGKCLTSLILNVPIWIVIRD